MPNKIEVMLDKTAVNVSIIATDDTNGTEVEHTLSLEEAWILVTDLNSAIRALTQVEPKIVHKTYPARVVETSYTIPPRVREAVLNSIGADNIRPRHSRPGSPATVTKKGLRNFHEELVGQ